MKYLKKYEEITEIEPPLKIGYNWTQYLPGVLLNDSKAMKIPYILDFLKKHWIKFRFLFKPNRYLILIENYEDVDLLPDEPGSEKFEENDRWIPFDDEGDGFGVTHFYKDIIDDYKWQELKFKQNDNYEELYSIINSNKYNL